MSAWEDVPGPDECTECTEAEWDAYMRDVYRDLRAYCNCDFEFFDPSRLWKAVAS